MLTIIYFFPSPLRSLVIFFFAIVRPTAFPNRTKQHHNKKLRSAPPKDESIPIVDVKDLPNADGILFGENRVTAFKISLWGIGKRRGEWRRRGGGRGGLLAPPPHFGDKVGIDILSTVVERGEHVCVNDAQQFTNNNGGVCLLLWNARHISRWSQIRILQMPPVCESIAPSGSRTSRKHAVGGWYCFRWSETGVGGGGGGGAGVCIDAKT